MSNGLNCPNSFVYGHWYYLYSFRRIYPKIHIRFLLMCAFIFNIHLAVILCRNNIYTYVLWYKPILFLPCFSFAAGLVDIPPRWRFGFFFENFVRNGEKRRHFEGKSVLLTQRILDQFGWLFLYLFLKSIRNEIRKQPTELLQYSLCSELR